MQKIATEPTKQSLNPQKVDKALRGISSGTLPKTLSWLTGKEDRSNSRSKKWFGKPPWNHRDSGGTISSVTSSVREVLAGKTPPGTPVRESHSNDQPDYETPYPAGEATRVRTPPLNEFTASGKPRGFFTNAVPPGEGIDTWDAAQRSGPSVMKQKLKDGAKRPQKRAKEWFETKKRTPQTQAPVPNTRSFEFDIPKHLPSSPMCPAHPKHSSQGRGLCVYHGRRRPGSPFEIEHSVSERRQGSEVSITSRDSDA
ncbi:hypothetical protein CSOJ01_00880 [Colletotrichum sojae]|uniref:Uncharacterized protein n=1 Tax=Colletotrichum sojae TaxID=2175907 RepID=A0A8H6JW28_9PEZI|nr:hypothetical protein CSOJ01_00880 [Colletotrichum sojae]